MTRQWISTAFLMLALGACAVAQAAEPGGDVPDEEPTAGSEPGGGEFSDTEAESGQERQAPAGEKVEIRRVDEAALNEDPEAQRRSLAQVPDAEQPVEEQGTTSLEFYGSARVHGINTFNVETGNRTSKVSDGNSRVGLRADWQYVPGWWLIGRGEFGIDLVENTSTRGDLFGDGGLTTRLLFAGIDSEYLSIFTGQNWSAFYQVAGITDRFAIFGGSASGVYNAGTAGQSTGTGRAEDTIQARTFVHPERWAPWLKPFRLNMQYQFGQPIPGLESGKYDFSFGASAFLELQNEYGFGLAYNRAVVPDDIIAARTNGLDGDAQAFAVSTRGFGDRWYASVVYSVLDNMETTDTGRYFDAEGIELYAQWEVIDRWWLIGGFNALEPSSDDPLVGEYRIRYGVVGGRYSIRSFERMVYVEYRVDDSRTVAGFPREDEVTIGIRWDFSL